MRTWLTCFSRANKARCEAHNGFGHRLESWTLSDWLVAIHGELGEASNVAKKLNRIRDGIPGNDKSEPELWDELSSELADMFTYLDLLCQFLGIDLADEVVRKFNKVSERIGYPVRLQ